MSYVKKNLSNVFGLFKKGKSGVFVGDFKTLRNEPIFLFLIILVSRLPFITNSPGADPDVWRVLFSGKKIFEQNIYEASRLPGYPLSEFLAQFFYQNFVMLNFITVLFTAIGGVFFYKILRLIDVKFAFWLTLAFAFNQAVFISSTTSMEYLWSVCFMLIAVFLALRKKWIWMAFFSALMVVARLNNIVLLLPIFILGLVNAREKIGFILKFSLAFIITLAIGYFPVISAYGFGKLPTNIQPDYDLKKIISFSTLYLFGLLGCLAIFIFFTEFLLRINHSVKIIREKKNILVISVLFILPTVIIFLKYPLESYYLIPIIPFLLIIIGIFLEKIKTSKIVLGLMIASPFLFHISKNKQELKGALFVEQSIENQIYNQTDLIIGGFEKRTFPKEILLAGISNIIYEIKYPKANQLKTYTILSVDEINEFKTNGYKIFYLEPIRNELITLYNFDINDVGVLYEKQYIIDR